MTKIIILQKEQIEHRIELQRDLLMCSILQFLHYRRHHRHLPPSLLMLWLSWNIPVRLLPADFFLTFSMHTIVITMILIIPCSSCDDHHPVDDCIAHQEKEIATHESSQASSPNERSKPTELAAACVVFLGALVTGWLAPTTLQNLTPTPVVSTWCCSWVAAEKQPNWTKWKMMHAKLLSIPFSRDSDAAVSLLNNRPTTNTSEQNSLSSSTRSSHNQTTIYLSIRPNHHHFDPPTRDHHRHHYITALSSSSHNHRTANFYLDPNNNHFFTTDDLETEQY